VEIMLVLDRSGSMAGTPLANLKTAAKNFVDFFQDTQSKDKMGLITFATGVKVDLPLGINFIDNGIKTKINAMTIPSSGDRDTNMEDALDQCDDNKDRKGSTTTTLTDQSGVAGDKRVQQFVIFFSDGQAKSFRGNYIDGSGNTVIVKFKRDGTDYDAVTTDPDDVDKNYLAHPWSGNHLGASVLCLPTGDGKPTATTMCKTCPTCPPYPNTRWGVFEYYPLSGHGVEECKIGGSIDMGSNSVMRNYILATARQMAIDHAGVLKGKYIKIYSIGLGSVDQGLLQSIASGPDYYYYAPSPSDLDAIFQKIAKEIKLRLVQ
jgi:von Willebrand factor type A domain.